MIKVLSLTHVLYPNFFPFTLNLIEPCLSQASHSLLWRRRSWVQPATWFYLPNL